MAVHPVPAGMPVEPVVGLWVERWTVLGVGLWRLGGRVKGLKAAGWVEQLL